MSRRPLLVVPVCEPGKGGGHLVRCAKLVRELRGRGREARLFLSVPAAAVGSLLETANFDTAWLIGESELANIEWECIVLDRFRTPVEEFSFWANLARNTPLIGIDEGGKCRGQFDFLIDILPACGSAYNGAKANISSPSLLPLPEKRESVPCGITTPPSATAPLKVLLSFGQEDSAGLGFAVARALTAQNARGVLDITLIRGGLKTAADAPALFSNPPAPVPKIVESVPNLGSRLAEYDLLITHYGLTAFEGVYAGVPVLLISPTPYHAKLARAAGFFSAGGGHGSGQGRAAKLARRLLKNNALNVPFLHQLAERRAALAARHGLEQPPKQSLPSLLDSFTPVVSRGCPVCGAVQHRRRRVIARFSERSYRRCPACGIISMSRLNPPPIEYAREYFFESYQKQYGKTYLEDFPHLMQMGKRRLAVIQQLLPGANSGRCLLDIGCAYGPFLAAAKAAGFSPCGIDPAEDAVRHITQTLGVPAAQGFFPAPLPDGFPAQYDVVTLWYVIEHFPDCVSALAEIRRILKPGGVLALATPSFSGVSGRSSLKRFLERSPADHWTVWSPRACKKALAAAGFKVTKTVTNGCHPERFSLLGKFARSPGSPLHAALLAISKIFNLGDTFEVYAIKM